MFDWESFNRLAIDLLAQRRNDADLRSSISRAYYAAFCTARERLRLERLPIPPGGAAHEFVWRTLRNDPDPARHDLGEWGNRLRGKRGDADYENFFPGNLLMETQYATQIATRVIVEIRKLPNP
jgi:hypothetical protein